MSSAARCAAWMPVCSCESSSPRACAVPCVTACLACSRMTCNASLARRVAPDSRRCMPWSSESVLASTRCTACALRASSWLAMVASLSSDCLSASRLSWLPGVMWILPCHGVSHAHGMRPVHLLGGLLPVLRLPGGLLFPCLRGLAVLLHVLLPGLPVRRTQVVASDRMHFAAIVVQRRPVQAIEQAVDFAAGPIRMQFRGVDPGCVDIALSVRRGDGADGDAATLQLHVHVTVKGFLLRAERCIAAAGTAWHTVVMAIEHAVPVAAFGGDTGILVRPVPNSQRGLGWAVVL